MDHMASACGRSGYALLLDCFSLAIDYVPVPDAIAIVVAHSGEARVLETSEYTQRAVACAAAAARIGVPALRDATPDQVADDPIARHVVSENARVQAFVDALKAGDFTTAGAVMDASHASLRDDYRVSTPALDDVVARFRTAGAFGARLTGAGFGGCAVALVPADRVEDIVAAVEPHYRAFSVSAADGANVIG
jgi:galactokinase